MRSAMDPQECPGEFSLNLIQKELDMKKKSSNGKEKNRNEMKQVYTHGRKLLLFFPHFYYILLIISIL